MRYRYALYLIAASVLVSSLFVVFALQVRVSAQEDVPEPRPEALAQIQFPIAELGGCENKDECRAYCEEPANHDACIEFAERNNLVAQEHIERFREHRSRFRQVLGESFTGPGGCTSIAECRAYCEQEGNRAECLQFGLDHGLLPPEASDNARRVLSILTEGGPGGCSTPGECRQYCENPESREECRSFALRHGLVDEEARDRLEERERFIERVRDEGGPGGCTGEEECRLYCSNPDNVEECIGFAQRHGFVENEEAREKLERFRSGEFEEFRERFDKRREEFELRFRAEHGELERRLQEEGESSEELRREFRERAAEFEGDFLEKDREQFERFRGEFEERYRGIPGDEDRFRQEFEQRQRDGEQEFEERIRLEGGGTSFIVNFFRSLLVR